MNILVEVNTEKENNYVYSKINYKVKHDWRGCKRYLNIATGSYYHSKNCAENNGYKIISFNEFKSRYESQIKIGDTFEYNGFVCEVKEEIKKWVYNTYAKSFYKTKYNHEHEIEITNKEFIKQLEENAR